MSRLRRIPTNGFAAAFALCTIFIFVASPTYAHVKWFAPYDIIADPKSILSIFTQSFYVIGALSIVIVFVAAWLDRQLSGVNQRLETYRTLLTKELPQQYEFDMLRYTLVIFFTAVWTLGGVALTPELKHDSAVISAIHLIIIASALFKRTAFLGGIGIFLLWFYSAYHYGFFHLSDYMIFLGIAIFIILSSLYPNRYQAARFIILYAAISITLQWASVEKFVYPDWSFPVLERAPHLTFGLSKESFMDLAGFGEFVLAFLLIAVSGFSFVGVTLFLAFIFIAAIYDFGKIDAIGHLAIIVALFMMAMHGPTSLNRWFTNLHKSPVINAALVTLLYCISVTLFFIAYYMIRKLWLLTISH